MEEIQFILPDSKDIERAQKLLSKSSNQIRGIFKLIKDPNKMARRGIALNNLSTFNGEYEYMITDYLKALNPSTELLEKFNNSIKQRRNHLDAITKEKIRLRTIAELPAKTLIQNKLISKIEKLSRNQILNILSLNKNCFGDEIKIKTITYEFNNNFKGYGESNVHITISFEHLSGYFFRDLGYSLTLDLKLTNDTSVFTTDYHRTICKLGKKDTKNLLLYIKDLKYYHRSW